MSLLLYAIFRPPPESALPPLSGVGGRPLFKVTARGRLAAVVSESPASVSASDLSDLLAYEKVVAALHRAPDSGGVIPMRYGSQLPGESQVRGLLGERGAEYRALLREIEGCEEMGICFTLPAFPEAGDLADLAPGIKGGNGAEEFASGAAYLQFCRNSYSAREKSAGERELQIERLRSAFAGVFRRMQTECRTVRDPEAGRPLSFVSLSFLVPRPCLPGFCRVAGEMRKLLPSGLLLSGPWPPFSFVSPDANAAGGSGRKKDDLVNTLLHHCGETGNSVT